MQNNNDILSQFSRNTAQRSADLGQSLDQSAQQRTQAGQNGGGFITNDQIAADQAAKDSQTQQPTAQPAPQPGQGDGDGGNWFTKALPTIGSIAAPILGALLAPETGGASLLAGLALAGGGSAAGKLGENALEGKKDVMNGVGGAALEGGAGQLVGGAAGKVLGGVAKGIGGIAEKGIANKGATTAAEDALANTQDTVNTFRGIPTSLKESNNPLLGLKGAQSLATESGVGNTDAQGMKNVGNQALDILGNNRDNILANSGTINTAGAVDAAGKKVAPSLDDIINSSLNNTHPVTGESLGLSRANILGSTDPVIASGKQLVSPKNDSTGFLADAKQLLSSVINKSDADPMALLEAQKQIGAQAHNFNMLAGKAAENGTANAEQLAAKAGAWNDLNSHVKDMLFNRPSVDEGVSALQGNIQAADVGGNQALADALNSRLSGAQTGQDLSTSLSHYINMKNIGSEALKAGQDTSSAQALNAAKLAVPGEQEAMLNLPTSKTRLVADMANKVLGAVGNGGATSQVASKLADNLTGASAIASKIAARAPEGAIPNIAGNYATNAGLVGTLGAQAVAGAPNYQGPAGTGTAVNTLDLPQSSGSPFQDILNSHDIASAPAKMAIIDSMFNGAMGQHTSLADPTITDYLNKQQATRNAAAQVNSYIQALNAAGGAQGRVGGLLGELGGALTGGPAAALGNQRAAVEQSLKQALGRDVSLPNMQLNQSGANGVLGQLNAALHSQAGM